MGLKQIRNRIAPGKKLVFVSGNFNIIHPGHLRLLNFAASKGDYLVVGVFADGFPGTHLGENLRLEGVRAISAVDEAFILREPAEVAVDRIRPDIVVKGVEWESRENPELPVLESYGGKLILSSGDTRFSLIDLLQKEIQQANFSAIVKPTDYSARHEFSIDDLIAVVRGFRTLKVIVIGDLIVDEYINCEPLGMSQEDPTIVVTPIKSDRYVGGAGIVAAHACGLGATVSYFCVTGSDPIARYGLDRLAGYGVEVVPIIDENRPTTLKQRFRANGKTLLRVSHLQEHGISEALRELMFSALVPKIESADLVVFSDFNYGCLPQPLVDRIAEHCHKHGVIMVADSQSSSQVGDISRFHGMRLLTPTEREARLGMRDFSSGLVVLAESLRRKTHADYVFITLGSEGVMIQTDDSGGNIVTDRLPAFNTAPKDVSGAGDSMLIAASMALAAGADIWQSAFLGSLAAGCQVGRLGNIPLNADELVMELRA